MIAKQFSNVQKKEIKSDEFMRNNLDLKTFEFYSFIYDFIRKFINIYDAALFYVCLPTKSNGATSNEQFHLQKKYPTWNIKRENVQYIFPKFNFVGEKGTTTTTASSKN